MPSNPAILLFGRIIPSPAESSSLSSLRAPDPPSVSQQSPPLPELSPRAVADHAASSLSHGASDDDDAPFKASCRPVDAADCALAKPQLADNSLMNDEDSAGRKLDKPVPCPRCNSLDTKFCYFNNYNVKQPRHFCRNCQRYWTAGGTLRNVPIGAGRRKHKLSAIVVPRSDHPDSAQPIHFSHGADFAGKISDPGLHIPLRRLIDSSPASSSLSSLQQHLPCSSNGVLSSRTQNRVPVERPAQELICEFEPKNREEDTVRKAEFHGGTLLSARGRESPTPLIKESTCCSSVTALSAPDVVSDVNEGGTSTLTSMPGALCFPNPATWGGAALPLIWPWPYMYSQGTGPPGVSPLQSDAKRDVSWPSRTEALFPSPPVLAAPVWTTYGWSVPWNFVWNANVAAAAGAQTHEKRPRSSAAGGADLYVPKTLRIHHPEEEEVGRSMSVSPPSAAGFLNRLKIPDALSQTQPEHTNPAAQARSIAFQERSS